MEQAQNVIFASTWFSSSAWLADKWRVGFGIRCSCSEVYIGQREHEDNWRGSLWKVPQHNASMRPSVLAVAVIFCFWDLNISTGWRMLLFLDKTIFSSLFCWLFCGNERARIGYTTTEGVAWLADLQQNAPMCPPTCKTESKIYAACKYITQFIVGNSNLQVWNILYKAGIIYSNRHLTDSPPVCDFGWEDWCFVT